jgi:hypothetical protein
MLYEVVKKGGVWYFIHGSRCETIIPRPDDDQIPQIKKLKELFGNNPLMNQEGS